MNFKLLLFILPVLFLFQFFNANAQQTAAATGIVSGRLSDAANNQPLQFATVSLIKKSDNLAAKSILTDMQGNFKLDHLPDGFYLLKATYVGYITYTKDSILITSKRKLHQLAPIKMKVAKGLLKEVSIKALRNAIQLGVDRKVFSVDQSLVSQGGSATDLLGNVPSIQVDVDGNINLRGSSNVRVLINGKPSALTGGNVTDILQSIPASAIEKIEVITNPSSKYDPEGQTGIINIVLKKNARLGYNGSASFSAGNQHTYNGNLNLAYQNKKINIYGNYSYRTADRDGNGYTNKTTFDPLNGPIYQNQIADQTYNYVSHNIRAGIDINLDPKTTLGFSGNINLRNRVRAAFGDTKTFNSTGVLTQLTSQNDRTYNTGNRNLDFSTDFDHKYKKEGRELTANIGYSNGNEGNNEYQHNIFNYYTPPAFRQHLQTNVNLETGYELNLQADYTTPLGHNNKLDAGYRSTFSQNDNGNDIDSLDNHSVYVPDGDLTNHFLYQEQVHAVYSTYQQQFGQYGIQGGLRIEDARIHTLLRDNNERHEQDYFRVYPSIFLSDKLGDNQSLQLSYTRRVSRPRDHQISPFLDKSDPFSYQQGNPNLKPEDTHSFELSYINYWKTLTLTSSVYYRLTNDNIQHIRTPIDTAVTLSHYENIKSAENSGFELIARINPTQNFDLTGNVNIYYSHLQGDADFDLPSSSGLAWNANLTANFKPVKKLGIQLRGDYTAPELVSQGRHRAMYGLDGGLRYEITKALNFSASIRDAFNSRKYGSITDYTTGQFPYHSESVRRFQTRSMIFTLSYHFGSMPDQKKNKKGNDQLGAGDNGNPDDGPR